MFVLGLSAFYHDSAAALVKDGEIVAAAQEERFTRVKADASFPGASVISCLDSAGISLDDVDFVGFYDKPLLTFGRLVETYLAYAPKGFTSFTAAIPVWVKEKILQKSLIVKELNKLGRGTITEDKIRFGFHHHSHAASAFYPSPFENAAILVMDGVGEWATTSLGVGRGDKIELLKEIRFPHSLGLLYSALTYHLGFKVNDGEYKVMGLAPYGEPNFVQLIRDNLIDVKDDGSYRLDMSYFNYCTGFTMTNAKFDALMGAPPRRSEAPLTQRHMDIARSIQVVTEDVVLKICHALHSETGLKDLCLAGGVALNCVANGRIARESPFERLWIQPASGDAGGSIGVSLAVAHAEGASRHVAPQADGMQGAYLGPEYDRAAIRHALDAVGARYHELHDEELFAAVAERIADERIVGWFQGRMEFGPRALGNRSILADPRSSRMQRMLNLKIKYRESFRPFAPAVLAEAAPEYFELEGDSPYMLIVCDVQPKHRRTLDSSEAALTGLARLAQVRSMLPAITHVDYSARIQTVHQDTNPRFRRLIERFDAITGCPMLVNTSFNVRDEPIVCSPSDAYACFMATEIDVLAAGNFLLLKEEQ